MSPVQERESERGSKLEFLDWDPIFGRDRMINIVLTARGRGKTYGLRLQCVRDFIGKGLCFVELCRTLDECEDVARDYYARIAENNEFPGYMFKTTKHRAYIAKRPENDEDAPKWKLIGYFCSLSAANRYKKKTFKRVRRFIMDEAIIDRALTSRGYLSNEVERISSIVDSVTRERPGERQKIYIYFLGNSCDLSCPILEYYGVRQEPKRGFTRLDKDVLVLYEDPGEYGERKARETSAARMLKNDSKALQIAAYNRFLEPHKDEIEPKPKTCELLFGLLYQADEFGIWVDKREYFLHISSKVPRSGHNRPIFAFSFSDGDINTPVLEACAPEMRIVVNALYRRNVRFESLLTREKFLRTLKLLGKI